MLSVKKSLLRATKRASEPTPTTFCVTEGRGGEGGRKDYKGGEATWYGEREREREERERERERR